MRILLLALGLFAYLATASVDGSTCDEGACSQGCSRDDAQGNCPPNCPDCGGCLHLNLMVVFPDVSPEPSPAPRVVVLPLRTPPIGEPAEILHVPIAGIA